MKKLIAFLRFLLPISIGLSILRNSIGYATSDFECETEKWLVSQKKVKPLVLSLMLQISTFFLQRMECLSISTVRI